MAFSAWSSRAASDANGRRTNSLGVAKVDCHTCRDRRRHCDRQRPQCGTCIRARRKCGGFAMDLVWKDHQRSRGGPDGSDSDDAGTFAQATGHDQPNLKRNPPKRAVRFVQGRAKAKRKPKERPSEPATFAVTIQHASDKDVNSNNDVRFGDEQTESYPFMLGPQSPSRSRVTGASDSDAFGAFLAAVDLSWAHDQDMDGTSAHSYDTATTSSFAPDSLDGFSVTGGEEPAGGGVMSNDNDTIDYEGQIERVERLPFQTLHPSAILYQNQAQKFQTILAMYDEEFCILPLSMDCDGNPFRVSRKQCETYPFLLHSVLALSFQHLAKQRNSPELLDETDRHRSMAVQLYSQALGHSNPSLLLDTLLLLFNFEVTQSAFSGWTVHLRGAQKILDGMNIAAALQTNSRIRAQVATLVWWDITLAFISRKECQLSSQYLDMLIEHNHKDEWTFFALNGCPAELMTAMRKLARLASICEKAAKLEWTTFNTHPVDLIVDDVLHFKNEEDMSMIEIGESDDGPDARRDRFHCIEAWRYAIVLYARRVFCAQQDAPGLRAIDHLTRVILDHVRCIRPTATLQKQVLLPLFLAAAELGNDHPDRDFVRTYCRHWSVTARYSQFESALSWLETIWLDWDSSTRSTYWWGCKVGGEEWGKGGEGGYSSIGPELLLG